MQTTDDQFAALFRYISDRFDKLEQTLASKADAAITYHLLDGITARLDEDNTERSAMNAQLNRHERDIARLAQATGMRPAPGQ